MKTAYIEADVKKHNLKNMQTGDLIKFEADVHPIIFHYGIIDRVSDKLYIYHNQLSFVNKSGGSMIREDFNEYANGRKIISIEKTGLNKDQLQQMADVLKSHKYDFVNNNCEHFVNKLKINRFISPTAGKIALGLVVLTGIIWYMKKR
tara:strand:- start:9 stop:452 length:444 start_codon:yes stop_codon:yes gene_type:complete